MLAIMWSKTELDDNEIQKHKKLNKLPQNPEVRNLIISICKANAVIDCTHKQFKSDERKVLQDYLFDTVNTYHKENSEEKQIARLKREINKAVIDLREILKSHDSWPLEEVKKYFSSILNNE